VCPLPEPAGFLYDDGIVCPGCAEQRADAGDASGQPIGPKTGEACVDCWYDFDGERWGVHRFRRRQRRAA
jgi:hypothetical protein